MLISDDCIEIIFQMGSMGNQLKDFVFPIIIVSSFSKSDKIGPRHGLLKKLQPFLIVNWP